MFPNLNASSVDLFLEIDGYATQISDRFGRDFEHVSGPICGSESSLTFLLSPDIDQHGLKRAFEDNGLASKVNRYSYRSYSPYHHGPGVGNVEIISGPAASDWHDHWLAYSCFTNIILTREFFDNLSQPAKVALKDYVSVGGKITIANSSEIPEQFSGPLTGKKQSVNPRNPAQHSRLNVVPFGLGKVLLTKQPIDGWITDKTWDHLLQHDTNGFLL